MHTMVIKAGGSFGNQIFFLLRTALKYRPKGSPTANCQPPPTATNRRSGTLFLSFS